jgi:hypothetical protein
MARPDEPRKSLKERTRLREVAEREQADKIGVGMGFGPFPNYSLEDIAEFDPGHLVRPEYTEHIPGRKL